MIANYVIPECNLSNLEANIDKLNRVAEKLGLNSIRHINNGVDHVDFMSKYKQNQTGSLWISEENFDETRHEKLGPVRNWLSITIDGDQPKFNGWTFYATLLPIPTDDGIENQIRKVPGIEEDIPSKYRTLVGQCDHCNQNRNRKETYLVRNEQGDYKVVGSSCLKDFLGHSDPHSIAKYLELFQIIVESQNISDDDWGFNRGSQDSYVTLSVLSATAAVIEAVGWKSKGDAYNYGGVSTADNVMVLFTPYNRLTAVERKFVENITFNDKHIEKAIKIFDWMKSIDSETQNDYLYNLSLLSRCSTIGYKSVGILCSAAIAYDRSLAKKDTNKIYANSQHVGKIKERLEMELTVNRVFDKETDFGLTRIHHMNDASGNYFVWFASSEGLEVGRTYKAKATIKAHSEFNGIKQTIVNRVTPIKGK